ncbi:MAG: Fic family protein [Sphaerochaetaceae bacterium]|nr:Fic family protein [Sphaerochaetaceae bacterium]
MEKQHQLDFEQYITQGEPEKGRNCIAWQTAIGLQAVDGLKASDVLIDAAKRNIEGELSIDEVRTLINSYYDSKQGRTDNESSEEADKVSINIRNILAAKAFTFSVMEFIGLHGQIFNGIFKHAGTIRTSNITKREWILDGDTVYYANAEMILKTLEYDFSNERAFNYVGLEPSAMVKHFSRFISNIWQVHPFMEGNTRTTAVFAIKYLSSIGFEVSNDAFFENSWYFRNALVRANYSNVKKGISLNTEFLEKFFENLLLGKNNPLRNRYLHINAESALKNLPVNEKILPVNGKNLPVNKTCGLILSLLRENPDLTYDDIAFRIGKTRETVRVNLRKLESLNLIKRVGPDKTGHWEVLAVQES